MEVDVYQERVCVLLSLEFPRGKRFSTYSNAGADMLRNYRNR
jgi:hypothetical protein